MKAVQFNEYGGPEVLRVVEVDEPHAGPGQVRIAVRAAGVNGIDWKIRAGHLRQMIPLSLPAGIGMDASGVVDEVGAGVDDVAVGDAVFGAGAATYAEFAVLSAWAKKPAALGFEEAAGYPIPVETAARILRQVGVLPGETLVVSGASGGVGSAVLQLARAQGITVIATASARNHAYLRSLGAIPTTYEAGLVARVRALAPRGIDAALDLAGSGVIADLIELTGKPAKVLSIADFTAPAQGAQVSAQTTDADRRVALAAAARLFTEGALRIPVEWTYALAAAGEAQVASAAGHVRGRLVIRVAAPASEARTTTLDPGAGYVTIINTYVVAPERAEALLEMLVRATEETLRQVPGFVSANFHLNLDRTRLVNYAQWQSREAIAAAGTDPRVAARIREAGEIADSFTPVLYELRSSVRAPDA